MHHCLHGLTSHRDVTRFELEDGILREAAPELLREATGIDKITIDLGVTVRRGASESPVTRFDSTLLISGATEADVAPTRLTDLLAEVAVIGATSRLEVTDVSQLEKSWIGTATPGPKLTAHIDKTIADSSDSRERVHELATSICDSLGNVGCRVMFGDRSEQWPITTSISFWFPNKQSAVAALDSSAFDPLVEQETSLLVEAIEHRLAPNPNTWGTKIMGTDPAGDTPATE